MKQTVDVIVNGAGPVGLLCAYLLIKEGLVVYLADKKEGPTEQSRALAITPRSLEILQHYGIAYRILQESLVMRGGFLNVNGYNIGMLHFGETDCVFPQVTSLPQSNVEKILVDEIKKIPGAVIHWQTQLTNYEQHGNHVIAHFKNTSKSNQEQVTAKYIVGADGCHSTVRKQDPTWSYEGRAIKSQFAMADLVLDGRDVDQIKNRQVVFYHSKGGCFFLPLPHNGNDGKISVRVVANMGSYELNDGPKISHGLDSSRAVLTLNTIKQVIHERMPGLDTHIVSSSWLSYFYINERIANGFRRGRAFLIGDAAHCHSPAGMNIGFHDAENLAWKLSLVLRGASSDPEKVLDSFSIEREPMAKAVLNTTSIITKIALGQSYFLCKLTAIVRYAAIAIAMAFPSLGKSLANRILQVDFRLGESPIFASASPHPLIQCGHFLKDTHALLNKDVTLKVDRKTVYQIMEAMNNKHVAFWMITRQTWQQEPDTELTRAFLTRIAHYKACRSVVVQSATQYNKYDSLGDSAWVDTRALSSDRSLTCRLGFATYLTASKDPVPPAALVLIRPDRYVAYSGLINSMIELDAAFTFMNSYLLSSM